MDGINLLWEIQKHRDALRQVKMDFKTNINSSKIEDICKELIRFEKKLVVLEKSIDEVEIELAEDNSDLKNSDYELKKVEKDLYEGKITDLKQLEFLDEEGKKLKEKIDKKESEIIIKIEQMENLKEEFTEIQEEFQGLRQEYTDLIKGYKILTKEYEQKVKKINKEIDQISLKVDENLLKRYNELGTSMENPIVEIVDHECLGCHMLLPTFLVDKLKHQDEIMYCESCGRILYIDKQE